MDNRSSLKGLAAIAVLKSKIFISPQEIPLDLYEDLQNLNFLVKLQKVEVELKRELESVKETLAHATYEHLLFSNMLIDSPTDDEVRNSYLWESIMQYSRMVSKCCKIKAEIAKDKIRRDDEEEITMQKLQE